MPWFELALACGELYFNVRINRMLQDHIRKSANDLANERKGSENYRMALLGFVLDKLMGYCQILWAYTHFIVNIIDLVS